MASSSEKDNHEEIEDIVVEFEGNFDIDAVLDKQIQLIGIDSEEPVLKIDAKFYKIYVKDSIGTKLMFKTTDEGGESKLEYYGNNSVQDTAVQKLGPELGKQLVRTAVNVLLVLGQNKNVIKRADLTRLIKSSTAERVTPMALKGIINLACHDLKDVFGIRVFETDPTKEKLLLANTRDDYNQYRNYTESEIEELCVLQLLMIEIFTSPEEKASEQELRDCVKTLVEKEEDFRRILESLLKKLYLVSVKCEQTQVKFVKWGPRAYAETDPDNFMKEFLDISETNSADDWPEQKRILNRVKELHRGVNIDPEPGQEESQDRRRSVA